MMGYDMHVVNKSDDEDQYGGNNYFRSNIFGMPGLRSVMFAAGVLDDTDPPEWPDNGPGGEPDEAALMAVRGFRSEHPERVPAAKFCSNDGWFVTADEAKLIHQGLAVLSDKDIIVAVFGEAERDEGLQRLVNAIERVAEDISERGGDKVKSTEVTTPAAHEDAANFDEVKFVRDFQEFNRIAAERGGYRVW